MNDLIRIASAAYPDDLIIRAHQGAPVMDGLAEFIAAELREVSDEVSDEQVDEQFDRAVIALEQAMDELSRVVGALRAAKGTTREKPMHYGLEILDPSSSLGAYSHEYAESETDAIDRAKAAWEESPWCDVCVWDTRLGEVPDIDSIVWWTSNGHPQRIRR